MRRFRAIPEICALAQSLPHTCCAPCSKVFSGQGRDHGHPVHRSQPCRPRHGHLSVLIDSMLLSQCLRNSCELPHLPRIRCPTCCSARRFFPPCPQVTAWVEQGRREWRRERQRERQREQHSSSDRREQMWRAPSRLWRAIVASICGKQILASSSPSRRATRTCRADVPCRRACRRAEQIVPSESRRWGRAERVALCWSRGAVVTESRSR